MTTYALRYVPDHFNTQEMCNEAVVCSPYVLEDVPDYFKTQGICNEAVRICSCLLVHVPDWFITRQPKKIWHDDDYWHNNAFIIKWYHIYQKRKSQKVKIKEELLPDA